MVAALRECRARRACTRWRRVSSGRRGLLVCYDSSQKVQSTRVPPLQDGRIVTGSTSGENVVGRRAVTSLGVLASSVVGPSRAEQTTKPVVLVIGASGKTGAQCVRALLKRGYAVRAGVRSVGKYVSLDESKSDDDGDALSLKDVLREYANSDAVRVTRIDVTDNVAVLSRALLDEGVNYIVCATGFRPSALTVLGVGDTPQLVDNNGTKNIVDAALSCNVKGFVLVSSLLTNAKAVGQGLNPNYVVLNLLGGVLDNKLEGELYLRKQSGALNWEIVRPGGLSDEPTSAYGSLVVQDEDTLFGNDGDPGRVISRETVAAVCADAIDGMTSSDFVNRVVEIVQKPAL